MVQQTPPLRRKLAYRRQAEVARATARNAVAAGRAGQVSRSSIQVGDDTALLDDVLAGAVGTGIEVDVIVGDVDVIDDIAADDQSADGSDIDVDDLIDIGDTDPDLGEEYDAEIAAEEALHAARMRLAEAQQELDAANAELDERLTSARADLDAAEADLAVTKDRVTTAEGQIGDMLTDLDTALQDAAQAQLDANLAKGMLSVKPAAPVAADGQGKPIGAMWVHHAASGIQTLYEWTALGWVPRPLSETIIPKVAIGTGTYGELDGVRLKADSVFARSLAVGDFTNYATIDAVRGVEVTSPPEWKTKSDGIWTTRGDGAQNYIMFKDRTDTFPFKGGDSVRVSFRAKATVASSAVVRLYAYPARSGGVTTGLVSAASTTVSIGTTEADYSVVIALPTNFGAGVSLQSWVAGLIPGSGVDMANVSVRNVRIHRMSNGELLVDGAVGAQHVATGTLQALAATITEAWIKNAHVVDLDVSKLVASSATLSEAVITKLWADVVKAKFLTVTEKIITKDVIALGAIDGMLITAPIIRTAPSGQRLQLDVNGLRAFDAAGVVKASLTAWNGALYLSGDIQVENGGVRSLFPDGRLAELRDGRVHLSDGAATLSYVTSSGFYGARNGLIELRNDPAGSAGFAGVRVYSGGAEGVTIQAAQGAIKLIGTTVTYPGDTDWISIGVTGWTHQVTPQARVRNGRVQFRGLISNNSFTGSFTACGTLPASIPRPPVHYRTASVGLSGTEAIFRVLQTGGMEMLREAATAAWCDLSRLSYEID